MPYEIYAVLLALGLFVAMIAMQELGHRLGDRVERLDPEGAHAGTGPVEGAVFALLGLLVAFSFSGAASRFDARRQLIVQEANDVGTAYLRLDFAPPAAQPELRDLFRRYLDTRLAVYRHLPDLAAARAELTKSEGLQQEIWAKSFAACRDGGPPARCC